MENVICSAYTYLEFEKDFNKYQEDRIIYKQGYTKEELKANWQDVLNSYEKVSFYMSDAAIIEAQQLVINEF